MSLEKRNNARKLRRTQRVRQKARNQGLPRVSVFRSLSHVYAQLIDDAQQKTLASCSSLELKDLKGTKKEVAHALGKEFAQRALKAGVQAAIFDRGSSLYHGRVQALAEGIREGGLRI